MLTTDSTKVIIDKLVAHGIDFANGLNEERLAQIESLLGATIPNDLRAILSLGVPIGEPNNQARFPRWDLDIDSEFERSQRFVYELFEADIKDDRYWNAYFGERPLDGDEQWTVAKDKIKAQPQLMPVYGHRYVIAGNDNSPVLSFHGFLDTIVYASSLEEYFYKEFGIAADPLAIHEPQVSGFWSTVLE